MCIRDSCACQITNQKIETVSNIKFLGFHLDDKLKFNNHVKHLNKHLARCNYTLSKFSKFLKPFHLMLIFNAIGLSHIVILILILPLSRKKTRFFYFRKCSNSVSGLWFIYVEQLQNSPCFLLFLV